MADHPHIARSSAWLWAATMAVLISGCGTMTLRGDVGSAQSAGDGNTGTAPNPIDGNIITPAPAPRPRYTLVGRFDTSNPNAPRFVYESTKIGAQFTGTSLAVDITDTGTDLFNVVIDGGNAIVLQVNPNDPPRHAITTQLQNANHTVWLSKRTESFSAFSPVYTGTVQFADFVIDANATFLEGPAAKPRIIEAIGDSGYTGWGVETIVTSSAADCDGNNDTLEDGDKSIPAFTAKASQAEIINLSCSGEAVVDSVVDSNPNHMLPVVWGELLAPSPTPAYDFSVVPDVVIISAGGDDLFGAYGSGTFNDPNAVLTTYAAWLQNIRAHYPKVFIVNVLSQSADAQDKVTLTTLYTQAMALAAPAGDPNMAFYDYWEGTPYTTYNDAASGTAMQLYWGCSGHPSAAGAQYLGGRLSTFINTHMGW